MAGTREPSNVVFLLGAGASKAAGVPDTYEFVAEFRASLGTDNQDTAALELVLSHLTAWNRRPVDIELLLETLTRIVDRADDPGLLFCRDNTLTDDRLVAAAVRLSDALRSCIKRRTYVEPSQTLHLDPLLDFIRHYGCIDIATLNYDTVIEEFGERQRIAVHDGFLPDWNLTSLQQADEGIRLYKLHGSVTWYETPDGRYVKDRARVETAKVKLVQAGESESLMLYPVRKWAYSEPMVGLLFEFKRLLEAATTKFLVVAGYSFRDHHVQGVIRDAMRNNASLELVLIDPAASQLYAERFAVTRGPAWPDHYRRRILCLPYCFERVLQHLKRDYLKPLAIAIDDEEAATAAVARGDTATQWSRAALQYGLCEHQQRLMDVLSKEQCPTPSCLDRLRLRVICLTNGAAAKSSARVELADTIRALRSDLIAWLQCNYFSPPTSFEVQLHASPTGYFGADLIVAALTELRKRAHRAVQMSLRPSRELVCMVRILTELESSFTQMVRVARQPREWVKASNCSARQEREIVAALESVEASKPRDDGGSNPDALRAALCAAIRRGSNRTLLEALRRNRPARRVPITEPRRARSIESPAEGDVC